MKSILDHLPETALQAQSIDAPETFFEKLTAAQGPLKDWHSKGWDRFLSTPFPSKRDESWRFSKPEVLDINGFVPSPFPGEHLLHLIQARSFHVQTPTAEMIFADGHPIARKALPQSLVDQGVFLGTFAEALNTHPELLANYLQKKFPTLGSEKFAALHQAYAHHATFLYIPKNVKVEGTIALYHWHLAPHAALFPHTWIYAEEGAQAHVMELYGSLDEASPGFICGMAHTEVQEGAIIDRTSLQQWNSQVKGIQMESAWLQASARFHHVSLQLGSRFFRFENQVFLDGPEAEAQLSTLSIAKDEQFLDERSLQVHSAPRTTSDLLYKNALFNESRTVFSGMIIVEPGAQKTDAYQTNRNLVLSETAEAIALPGLEIEANDVKCSHGATTASVDEAQLFYLQSRGISRPAAERLLIQGFFEEVLQRIPLQRDWVQAICQLSLNPEAL